VPKRVSKRQARIAAAKARDPRVTELRGLSERAHFGSGSRYAEFRHDVNLALAEIKREVSA